MIFVFLVAIYFREVIHFFRRLVTVFRKIFNIFGTSRNEGSSESASTGVWCVPGFGTGFEIALEPLKLQKEGENPAKVHFHFLRQTLVCTKPWFKRDLRSFHKNMMSPQLRSGKSLLQDKQKKARQACARRGCNHARAPSSVWRNSTSRASLTMATDIPAADEALGCQF